MLIERVLLRDLRQEGERMSAVVICHAGNRQVSILASIPRQTDPAPALVEEALHRLRALSGPQSDARHATLAPGAPIEIDAGA